MTWPLPDALRIHGGKPLCGAVQLGSDQRVLECALAVAALGHGRSELQGVIAGEQLDTALVAWTALGTHCTREDDLVTIVGGGVDNLSAPRGALEAGRSRDLLAQLAGVLGAQRFGTRIQQRPAPLARPVDHVVGTLRARGAQIAARSGPGEHLFAPLAVAPLVEGERLSGIEATLPVADSAAKSALLLSGLYAAEATTLSEPHVSFDGLERLLVALGVPLRRIGSVVALDVQSWDRQLPALGTVRVPGSAVEAAHLAVAALGLAGSDVTMRAVSINPSHSSALELLRSWGAAIAWTPVGDATLREPIADVRVKASRVRGGVVDAELLVGAGEAVPALAALAASSLRPVHMCELAALGARGDTDLRELDPVLAAFGLARDRTAGELRVTRASTEREPDERSVDAQDDPGLALLACTLALASRGVTVVQHAAHALSAVYPGFLAAARQLGASIESA
jgi:5-enolpyruvylshikimate-3-phosphate synthase